MDVSFEKWMNFVLHPLNPNHHPFLRRPDDIVAIGLTVRIDFHLQIPGVLRRVLQMRR